MMAARRAGGRHPSACREVGADREEAVEVAGTSVAAVLHNELRRQGMAQATMAARRTADAMKVVRETQTAIAPLHQCAAVARTDGAASAYGIFAAPPSGGQEGVRDEKPEAPTGRSANG